MQKLLSIVVPVYKVEKYINKCLDSLIVPEEQMKKLEVIVVNDGTPDNSAIMAKEYEKRYPETFKVIDKENGGHGSAWNKGVELATGKYLRFLDSDDWLTNLPEFINRIEKYNVDLIFTDLLIVNEQNKSSDHFYDCSVAMNPGHIYKVEEFEWEDKTRTIFHGYNITNFHMCTYRTELLRKDHPVFLEKMFYDDEILFILPLSLAKSFVYFDITLYNYLMGRPGQTMDINTTIRNINFKVMVRKYLVNYYNKNKVFPENVKKKIHYILNSRIINTFSLMALLPYSESISKLREFDSWVKSNYAEFNGGSVYSLYKSSSVFFWLLYHYIRPLWAFFKIRILE